MSALDQLLALPAGYAAIALGANLGAREVTLEAALAELEAHPDCQLLGRSSWHSTTPVGGPSGQPDFLNGAAVLATSLDPECLLQLLHEIEARHGRERGLANGPRTLDLDLLLHGSEVRHGPGLELPHPRLHTRRFVLAPLAELLPRLELRGSTVAELRDAQQPEPLAASAQSKL